MSTLTMKFGGTSVGSPEAIGSVVQIVSDEVGRGSQVVVVVSAMSGVTDALINTVREAAIGNKWGYLSGSQKLRDRHVEALNWLIGAGSDRDNVMLELDRLLAQHVELCHAVNTLGEATPRINDAVISFGERLSCRIVAAALRQQGIKAQAFDASDFIITDDHFGSAVPLWDATETRIRDYLVPLLERGVTPVITGFIGATRTGQPTTLGRGGSDYSGAIFAAFTDSSELVIWTDVDGVMTADPRIDQRAKVLPSVSYTEVGELAFLRRESAASQDRPADSQARHSDARPQYVQSDAPRHADRADQRSLRYGHQGGDERAQRQPRDGWRARHDRRAGDRRTDVPRGGEGRGEHPHDLASVVRAEFLFRPAG